MRRPEPSHPNFSKFTGDIWALCRPGTVPPALCCTIVPQQYAAALPSDTEPEHCARALMPKHCALEPSTVMGSTVPGRAGGRAGQFSEPAGYMTRGVCSPWFGEWLLSAVCAISEITGSGIFSSSTGNAETSRAKMTRAKTPSRVSPDERSICIRQTDREFGGNQTKYARSDHAREPSARIAGIKRGLHRSERFGLGGVGGGGYLTGKL